MDMGSSTMAMTMASTATSAASASTSSAMSMSMGGGSSCKISMLWNWYTIDACFLSPSWHITSHGMFAGSCIGVILLVMVLELLRRGSKEYDAYLIRSRSRGTPLQAQTSSTSSDGEDSANKGNGNATVIQSSAVSFSPNPFEQAVRALLHMAQFAVAYIIMLLAMYYNGYIIICIFIGAFLGYYVFGWTRLTLQSEEREVTFCCG